VQIVKAINSSLLTRVFQYQNRYFCAVSAVWGFRLSSGENILEQEVWELLTAQLGKGAVFDEAMNKSCAEFLVSGSAFAPDGKAVARLEVDVSLGNIGKRLNVFGDRYWQGAGPAEFASEPMPFKEMPLNYHHAFGGSQHPYNTSGKGCPSSDENALVSLPNIEHPDDPVVSSSSTPFPAGFSSMDCSWPVRSELAGTFDDDYLKKHMPGFAPDMNWEYFNVAPKDQRFQGYLKGDESFAITHMHSEMAGIHGRLPGVAGRCLVERRATEETIDADSESRTLTTHHEVPLKLDTVHFFPNVDMGVLIHRGTFEVFEPLGQDISKILIAHQNLDEEKKSKAFYLGEMQKRTDPEEAFKYLLNSKTLVPLSTRCGLSTLTAGAMNQKMYLSENFENYAKHRQENAIGEVSAQKEMLLAELDAMEDQKLAAELKGKLLAAESPQADLPDDEKRLKELAEKVIPDLDALKNELDLSQVNFDALNELNDEMEAFALARKASALAQMKSMLDELKQQPESQERQEAITEIEQMVADMELPPVLPRPKMMDKEELDGYLQQMQEQVQSAKELNEQLALHPEQQTYLQEIEESMADKDMLSKLVECECLMFESYLKGAHFIAEARSPHPGQEQQQVTDMLERFQAGESVSQSDIAFGSLDNQHFENISFARSYFEYGECQQIKFSNVDLSESVFSHRHIRHCSIVESNVKSCNFGAAYFENCRFENLDFDDVTFGKASLKNCRFVRCTFGDRQDMFLDVTFDGCEFLQCELSNINFIELSLENCQFTECNLTETNFIKPRLCGSSFSGSNLSATNFLIADLKRCDFSSATLENTRFVGGCNLDGAVFDHALIHQTNLRDCSLCDSSFVGADLSFSDLSNSKLRRSHFSGAKAIQTQFVAADLRDCIASHANFMEVNLMQADIRNSDFSGANLYSASFFKATIGNTRFMGAYLENTLLSDWRPAFG
jgi:uncharacterized protein YjbI with pentapeptide repeats